MADKFNLDGFAVSTADVCTADGGFVGDVVGFVNPSYGSYSTTTPAIALTVSVAYLTGSVNAVAATLADGTEGQIITVLCDDSTEAVTLVPAEFLDGTTITFDVGEYITLLYTSAAGWITLALTAAVT